MKNCIRYIILILVLGLNSCESDDRFSERVEIPIDFTIITKYLDSILPIRIIVTNASTGEVVLNAYPLDLSTLIA